MVFISSGKNSEFNQENIITETMQMEIPQDIQGVARLADIKS
jgi:hypothetical protein